MWRVVEPPGGACACVCVCPPSQRAEALGHRVAAWVVPSVGRGFHVIPVWDACDKEDERWAYCEEPAGVYRSTATATMPGRYFSLADSMLVTGYSGGQPR